MNFRGFC
ncbi:hypothetical protein Zm00014a_003981 [Zea mays]|nr:hypothetical protein Zm00014a_003981 [Zea mays]